MSFLTDPDYSKKYWAARDAAKDLPVEIYKRLQDKGEYLELRLCERSEGIWQFGYSISLNTSKTKSIGVGCSPYELPDVTLSYESRDKAILFGIAAMKILVHQYLTGSTTVPDETKALLNRFFSKSGNFTLQLQLRT